jgi:tetratricopeptide (TPR) repeat protein
VDTPERDPREPTSWHGCGTLPAIGLSRRQDVFAVAKTYPEDSSALDALAWELVRLPGRVMSDYRKPLRYSEEACQLEPNNGDLLTTLGVAYYRAGNDEKALNTLPRSDTINKTERYGAHGANLAFLAMTLEQLGQTKEAKAELERLRESERMRQDPRWGRDAQAQVFLRQAEELLAKLQALGSKYTPVEV